MYFILFKCSSPPPPLSPYVFFVQHKFANCVIILKLLTNARLLCDMSMELTMAQYSGVEASVPELHVNGTSVLRCCSTSFQALKMKIPLFNSVFEDFFKK